MTVQAIYGDTLDYYDGPILFTLHSEDGGLCVAVAISDDAKGERFMAVRVDRPMFEAFKAAKLDLLTLIEDRPSPEWFIVRWPEDGATFTLEVQGGDLSGYDKYLPSPGYFLQARAPQGKGEPR